MSRKTRRNTIQGQWTARRLEMVESAPWRVLSLSGHRLLDRLEIELRHHAGRDNGKLPVTFTQFEEYGIDRHSIAPAMREVAALGFAEVTEHGRAGNAEHRTPNKFRLTYQRTDDREPTDDWQHIKTIEDAKARAMAARKLTCSSGKKIPVGENTSFSGGNPHRKPEIPSGGNPHYSASAETPTTLDISREGERPRPYLSLLQAEDLVSVVAKKTCTREPH
jgi:hypothetical protein